MAKEVTNKPTREDRLAARDGDPDKALQVFRAAVERGNKRQICVRFVAAQKAGAKLTKADEAAQAEAWESSTERGKVAIREALEQFEKSGQALTTKRGRDATRTKRSTAHLDRLEKSGGKPVRVDTNGDDLKLLEAMVFSEYAPTMAEVYRKAMRAEHAKWMKKVTAKA